MAVRFSIVVPSYNQARFLPACLDSLLGQAEADPEILVYDGGSGDGSREIIEARADRLAYWRSGPDGGQAAALREGFARATGDVFGWVNSDDLLLPGALKAAADFFRDEPDTALLYGDAVWIDADGRVLRPKREIPFDWEIFAYGYCYLPQPSAFFSRTAYEAAGGVDPDFTCCMDYDLWHRLARIGPVRHVPRFLSGIREHPETKTARLGATFRREADRLRVRYVQCGRTAYRLRHLWHRLRRAKQRFGTNSYRPLTAEEIRACSLTPR